MVQKTLVFSLLRAKHKLFLPGAYLVDCPLFALSSPQGAKISLYFCQTG